MEDGGIYVYFEIIDEINSIKLAKRDLFCERSMDNCLPEFLLLVLVWNYCH